MKKIAVALVALAAVIGFVGCTNPTNSTPTTTLSKWQFKGSQDGWTLHQFTVDPLNTNKLTYVVSTPYKTTYQFVLVGATSTGALGVDPDNLFKTSSTTVAANDGIAFSLVADPTGKAANNVQFHADFTTYTVTVDISNPSAPSVKLVAGTTASAAVTAAVLGAKLQIKGDQFSKIDGNAVAAWTATSPQTANLNSATGVVSWDVYVDSKLGTFGLNSDLDGWIAGSGQLSDATRAIDVSSATTTSATTPMNLTVSGASNIVLINMPDNGATYKLTVTPTAPIVAYGAGSYTVSVALVTPSTTAWTLYTPFTNAYLVGSNAELGSWTPASAIAMSTTTAGVFTKQIAASVTGTEEFQILPTNTGWTGQLGYANGPYGIVVGTGSIALPYPISGNNISFSATSGSLYTITVDMSTAAFTANSTPTVTVTSP
ncbi:MAG TPA: hypothetical protein VMV83_13360 [Rectinemataceae bacterium]|nr:hypothetical protein [Rectinemataceae bacterium]